MSRFREDGFYWGVWALSSYGDNPEVFRWEDNRWYAAGNDTGFHDDHVIPTSDRLDPP